MARDAPALRKSYDEHVKAVGCAPLQSEFSVPVYRAIGNDRDESTILMKVLSFHRPLHVSSRGPRFQARPNQEGSVNEDKQNKGQSPQRSAQRDLR